MMPNVEPTPPKPAPDVKPADSHDKSSVGEEDPGAAVEEMHDPHPDARPPKDKPT